MYRSILRSAKVAVEKVTSAGLIALLAMLSFMVVPSGASAAGDISGESTSLSDPTINQTAVTYTLDMDLTSASLIRCIRADFGTAADGSSAIPGFNIPTPATSFSGTSDFIPTPGSWTEAFTVGTGVWEATLAGGETPASASDRTIVLSGVTNGTTKNTTYFVVVTTYSDAGCTTLVDSGGQSAFVFTEGVVVSATVNPTLVFTVNATTCALGVLSAATPSTCIHTFTAASNATSGYAISYIPTSTLTSGVNTITANAAAAASIIGTEQFGFNLRDNSAPDVGADPTLAGHTYGAGYGTVNSFIFEVGGATIATTAGPTDSSIYTATYLANITSATQAGQYNATQTYNITATY